MLLLATSNALAVIRYVDSTAPAGGNGLSWATAWRGHNEIAGVGAGDTVYVSGGTSEKVYSMGSFTACPNGTAGSPFTLAIGKEAAHNGLAIFRNSTGSIEWLRNRNHVTIDGRGPNNEPRFQVENYNLALYMDAGVTGIRFLGVNCPESQVRMLNSKIVEIGWCVFGGNHKIDGGPPWIWGIGQGSGDLGYGNGSSIHDNTVWLFYLHGVDAEGDNGDDAIRDIGNCDVYNNRFISRLTTGFAGDNHQDAIQTQGRYIRIFNNYFENLANYMIFYESFGGGTKRDVQIFNNVFNYSDPMLTRQPSQAIAIGGHNSGTRYENFHVFNNTFRGGAQSIAFGDNNGVIASTCHIVNNLRGPGAGAINNKGSVQGVVGNNVTVTSDNSFANIGTGDFRLESASEAIDKGTNTFVDTVTQTDADGVRRPQGVAWDIGAHEFTGSTPTPEPTPTPLPESTPTPTQTPNPTPTPAPISGVTIWPSSVTPSTTDAGRDKAVELGVKFRSDVAGTIRGIRFYKASTNTGTHVGNLWSSTGTLLASAVLTEESASGWQQVEFATPVTINANTVYVASYHTNTGHYSFDANYFASSGADNPPLHALASAGSGDNGVFRYGANSAFPTQTWKDSNYWVDIVFQPQAQQTSTPNPRPAPTPGQVPMAPVNLSITTIQ